MVVVSGCDCDRHAIIELVLHRQIVEIAPQIDKLDVERVGYIGCLRLRGRDWHICVTQDRVYCAWVHRDRVR